MHEALHHPLGRAPGSDQDDHVVGITSEAVSAAFRFRWVEGAPPPAPRRTLAGLGPAPHLHQVIPGPLELHRLDQGQSRLLLVFRCSALQRPHTWPPTMASADFAQPFLPIFSALSFDYSRYIIRPEENEQSTFDLLLLICFLTATCYLEI